MLRIAKQGDIKDCAKLIYMSGPHIFSYTYCDKIPTIYKLLEFFVKNPDNTFSHNNIIVDEDNQIVRGLIIAHPPSRLISLLINEIKCIIQMHGGLLKAFLYLFKMISRLRLIMYYPKLKKGEYFIITLAIFDEFRGKSLSTKLMKKVENIAKEKGYTKLSLFVETDNEHAKKVYEKYGFVVEKEALFPKKYEKYGLLGFYKMVKVI